MTPQDFAALLPCPPTTPDAVTLLKADHALMNQLFVEYQQARSVDNKQTLVAEICVALSVHAQIEEEIFYPAMQEALKDERLMTEACGELARVKGLIAELEEVEPDGDSYDALVGRLRDRVKNHVYVEHKQLFPKAMASSLDMVALGATMDARMQTLLAQAA